MLLNNKKNKVGKQKQEQEKNQLYGDVLYCFFFSFFRNLYLDVCLFLNLKPKSIDLLINRFF